MIRNVRGADIINADFRLLPQNSLSCLATLEPLTPSGQAWAERHLARAVWIHGAVGLEPRDVAAVLDAIRRDGMRVIEGAQG